MTIGSELDHRTYQERARKHQPADIRDAIRALADQGLKSADISRLLECSQAAVDAILKSRPSVAEAATAHAAAWQRVRQQSQEINE
jgi:hypothetical protein